MNRACVTSTSAHSEARGFSLLELLVAMAMALILVAGAARLFNSALTGSFTTTQRAEMQEDVRAAQNLMARDISLAGSGLPNGGVGLPNGGSGNPVYGCDGTQCYLPASATGPSGMTFPLFPPGPPSPTARLYYIMPGPQKGPTINGIASDIITVAYTDNVFLLNQYTVTVNNAQATSITFTATPTPTPMPSPSPTPVQAVNDPSVGLQPGDLVFFQNASVNAIGEVTTLASSTATTFTVNFASTDQLHMNQPTATGGDMTALVGAPSVSATRIWLVSYYLNVLANGTPRLMRQVNGQTPVPVAENIVGLNFTYDTYDDTGQLMVALADAGASLGTSPNMIRKVNISMTARSAAKGISGYQGLNLVTEISARNMSFKNRYQ